MFIISAKFVSSLRLCFNLSDLVIWDYVKEELCSGSAYDLEIAGMEAEDQANLLTL